MKLSKVSQLFLVSSIVLVVATLLTACQLVTVDYVYVADSAGSSAGPNGQIEAFATDSQSGALRQGHSPVSCGGVDPVAMTVSGDYANLYVANAGSDSIVHFVINGNGSLTQKDTLTLNEPPASIAVDSQGTYLYVVSGTTTATLSEYALSKGTLGSLTAQVQLTIPGYPNDGLAPTGVNVLANTNVVHGAAVFATAYDLNAYNPGGTVTSTAHPGWVFSYAIGSGGTLTPAAGGPFQAGVKPSAVISDPTDHYLYVTDFASNHLIGYAIQSGYSLAYLLNGPFKTGDEPQAIAMDPRGMFMYVANALDSSVTAYVITLSTGTPSVAISPTGSPTNSTDSEPVSIAVDPALGRFVYTANYIGNSISGFRLDPIAGTLAVTQATPYPTGTKPSALVIAPHGNHSSQAITP